MRQQLFTLLAATALTAGCAFAAPGDRVTGIPESPFSIPRVSAIKGSPLPSISKAPSLAEATAEAVPCAVESMIWETGADYGEVKLTWSPVTKMTSGADVPANLTYTICELTLNGIEPVKEGITGTTTTLRVCEPTAQQGFVMYAVYAVVPASEGSSELISDGGAYTGMVPVGQPESMPWNESFLFDHILGQENMAGDGEWVPMDDSWVASQDGDGAYMLFMANQPGDMARIFTGRIHVDENVLNPTFSYWYYNMSQVDSYGQPVADTNSIQVLINDGSGFKKVGEATEPGKGNLDAWNRAAVSLEAYKGKDVQIAIQVVAISSSYIFLDNMEVKGSHPNDLTVSVFCNQTRVAPGDFLTINAAVDNFGANEASDYTVTFMADGANIGVMNGPKIAAGASGQVKWQYTVPNTVGETLELSAKVEIADDGDPSNDVAAPITIAVKLPNFPAVSNLNWNVENDGSALTLNWNEPSYDGISTKYTEDFEEFDSFATTDQGYKGNWIFVDRDGGGAGGMEGFDYPNVPKMSKQSWIVCDHTWEVCTRSEYTTHSGNQMLMGLYNANKVANDDWAISPALSGNQQTISFFARPYDEEFTPEIVDVMISSTDDDPANFTLLKTFRIEGDYRRIWTECEAVLPAGTKYFALRYRSTYQFILFIDDVTYEPAGAEDLELLGYNVYCNDKKLNDTPVVERKYEVKNPADEAEYAVTAVYAQGESRASSKVKPISSGVESVDAASVIVRTGAGVILVAGTDENASVYDLQGRMVYNGKPGVIDVASGAYIVRVAGKSWKVLVH